MTKPEQFKDACQHGDLNKVNKIVKDLSPELIQLLLSTEAYLPFRLAYDSKNQKLIQRLLELVNVEKKYLMLVANNNLVFNMAMARNDEPFIYYLLGCPEVFALAYENKTADVYLLHHIENTLKHPDAPHHDPDFEKSEEILLYFYFLQYLICCTNQKYQMYFDLIVKIPSIREYIIFDETTGDKELSTLAQKAGNITAKNALHEICNSNPGVIKGIFSYIQKQTTPLIITLGLFSEPQEVQQKTEEKYTPSISS